ncbi:TPA: DUF1492 domain-containing protein [Streptococcus equi subsp. zooepidemicus]|uniref:Phage associated protein n=2 Tax=Streptococcus equi subsp. zooepidemicus TaxID=40041 RepID=A0ABP2X876_STRSZ|nr:DUF1492 domain-containing protein [Streptococcus equi]KIS15873.1 phage associated protein [Streptococcus equi subsp. zooepidemicus Sz4is]EQB22914.1 phage associated protein [Streptococcus equi subsp. zooepidemicus SzS31A1]KIS04473.1 phage associated protein [Streptococcus equi subsp. zooepidemicus Sz12is]MCD3385235.1 DUF1492 domain-containing protein [Streptococcus equi subsp. zooepidemicus]MCD3389657.1 DUF1492 domain-containing protein [Streptococcus equi subsp. zooepidemicus]
MGTKEQLKELKPLFALMTLFEEQRDKDIKLINTFHNSEVLKDIEKGTARQLLYLGKEHDKRLVMIATLQNEKQIAVIKAKYIDGLSWDEIPDKLGYSRNTVFK